MFSGSKVFGLRKYKLLFLIISLTLTMFVGAQQAHANSKYAAFVYDANKGEVLFSKNADSLRYPASLTKMMTLYMVFDAMDSGKMSLSTQMKVSQRAAAMPPSKLYLKPGSTIRVKDAILALVTKSANDVAVVIAEHISGSEAEFAKAMTRKAHAIGMTRTTFANASGLPNDRQRTTARDMARLGLSLREEHPKSFQYFATRSFTYAGRTYRNHNRLLGRVDGVNGIKTGYIRASGFNLVTNVERDDRHLVAVVMGGETGRSRDAHMATLINRHINRASTKDRKHKSEPLLVKDTSKPASVITSYAPEETPPLPEIRPHNAAAPVVVAATPSILQAAPAQTTPTPSVNPVIVAATTPSVDVTHSIAKASDTKREAAPASQASSTGASTTTVADEAKTGWKIQLSATPNLNAAKEMLAEATEKGAPVLAEKTPYTETVKQGSSTLYRVRFAGFEDQSTARQACKFLKSKNYQCIYLN